MRGPLTTLVSRVIATILDDLPRAFRFDDGRAGQRTDMPLLPVAAIREAVVNSVIHRNYQVNQPVQIVRYSNRVEFRNPGYSLKSEDRFDDPASIMRNPHIAEVMHETRYAETKGSGIRRMRQFMEESGLSSPSFDSDRDSDMFTAIFLFHHFLNPEDVKWLSGFKEFDLTDDQRRVLIFVREVGAIDNQNYRSLTKMDTLEASRSLRKLTTSELLAKKGSSSRTYYVPGAELLKRLESPPPLEPNPQDLPDRFQGSDVVVTVDMVPVNLRRDVTNIALGQKLTADLAHKLIIGLCKWRPLSATQLGRLLGKNPSYLSQNYLSGMIREGALGYLYPSQVNHPGQKYVAPGSRAIEPQESV